MSGNNSSREGNVADGELRTEQQIQEAKYCFPYHYLGLYLELFRRLNHLPYLSLLRTVRNMLAPFAGETLLDAGCGDGRFCYELRNDDVRLIGVDYSHQAVRFAKAFNPSASFHVVDLTEVQFDVQCDIVTALEVMEHIIPEKVPTFVDALVGMLRPGGRLLISVPSVRLPVSKKHYQHFTVDGLTRLFSHACQTLKLVGHIRGGKHWRRFARMRKRCRLLWPLRNRLAPVRWYLARTENYFADMEICDPKEGNGIIALFQKR